MNISENLEAQHLTLSLNGLATTIRELAENHRGDSVALLALLRMLENIHQEVRDSLFQESLPDNRQALYNLLKDIESSGGWPYIYRMKLQALLANLSTLPNENFSVGGNSLPNTPYSQEPMNE